MNKAVVIGSGIAGLSVASFLQKSGWQVSVLEKHDIPGGRARQFKQDGFTFDMGPSWYWMPDVFEKYFQSFGKKISDCYQLARLDPSYRVYWEKEELDIPAKYPGLRALFEKLETGSGARLDKFLEEAADKYEIGINKLVLKPGQSVSEFLDWDLLKGLFKLQVFTSVRQHVNRIFKNTNLRQLLQFPVLFLGALPANTPALYTLMNYADMKLGTWYPHKGMYAIVNAMYDLARELGVQFYFNHDVQKINFKQKIAKSIEAHNGESIVTFDADVLIGAADYHFIENELVPPGLQSYSKNYWSKRTMAPSCLLYFIGLNKKLANIRHHSLFFDSNFEVHAKEIYSVPQWPTDPMFYVSATSVTDYTVAPEGCENLFFLVPVASGLTGDSELLREKYFNRIVARYENRIGEKIKEFIVFKKTFGPSDFVSEYNAFKGNAYGLANTLLQTAVFKPSCRSKKVKNLFYAGQLTVPGPGVPPALISGEVVANEVIKFFG
ncbi:MAG: phytoene desaturase family protein [Ginsengibacter sp.]